MVELSGDEKQDIRTWLTQAFVAAAAFDGSEQADNDFYQPLEMFDDFVRTHAFKGGESHLESAVASAAFPEGYPVNMPYNVDEFLDSILPFYQRLVEAKVDLQRMLEEGGADVRESTRNFVNTDEGHMHAATSDKSRSYEVKTQLRLASLIAHLRNDGVMIGGENQPIYMDDLRITFGKVDPDMMREYPYNIVQIPRLNMEIAVCEQASETTFVKRGTVDDVFWDVMSKNDLKARADVWDVPRHNDTQWWNDITRKLSGNAVPSLKKVNVIRWVPSVALDLAKETLLAHYQATGQALSSCAKNGKDEKIGSYILEHGSYADGVLMARGFNERLKRVDTSIAQLNEELANKHEGFDYTNFLNVPLVDLDLAKETLLTHYQATGQALSSCAKNGKGGNYILEHGFYANGVLTSGAFNERLTRVDTSIVQLNEELAQKYDDFNYVNHFDVPLVDLDLAKKTLLAHYQATGQALSSCAKNGKGGNGSYILEHGFYADGVLTSGAFNQRLGKVATLIAQEYTAIMDDLGVEEGTLAHRKKVLGGILKDFSDDLQDEFDGDEAAITAHAETLSLEDYYAALKSYLLQEELVSAPTLEC